MEKIKTFLSGINNMLIFIFKVDCTKWKVLFDNRYLRIKTIYCSHTTILIPYIEVLLHHTFSPNTGNYRKLFILINFYKFCICISMNNQ